MVIISYNVGIEVEIMELFEKLEIKEYTKFEKVKGVGKTSGPHLGDHIWPAINSLIFTVLEEEKKNKLIEGVKNLRKLFGKEGIKAFVLPVEEIT